MYAHAIIHRVGAEHLSIIVQLANELVVLVKQLQLHGTSISPSQQHQLTLQQLTDGIIEKQLAIINSFC